MKSLNLFFSLGVLIIQIASHAQIPSRPNAYDQDSLRIGKWVVLYDSLYENEVHTIEDASYYCLMDFKQGRPQDLVECFYMDGIKQYEGWLLSFDPMIKHGQATYYYKSGLTETIVNYQYDSLHGSIEAYHANGLLSASGAFDNNERTGDWAFYHASGQLSNTCHYDKGLENGWVVSYDEKGRKIKEGQYIHGVQHGEWKSYHPNGQLQWVCRYDHGSTEGKCTFYYASGQLEEINHNSNDQLHGPLISYHDNGEVKSKGEYQQGKRHGMYAYYHDNGKVESTGHFDQGKETGVWKKYHANGHLKSIGKYAYGKQQGVWEYYNEQGILTSTGYIENDLWEGMARFYDNIGQLTATGQYQNDLKEGRWVYYDGDSLLASIKHYHQDTLHGNYEQFYPSQATQNKGQMNHGQMHGPWQFYHANGSLSSQEVYDNGIADGHSEAYYENGTLKQKGAFRAGQKTGHWEYYFENGQVTSSGDYEGGHRVGPWKFYHSNGQVSSRGIFENGRSQGTWTYYHENGQLRKKGIEKDDLREGYWEYYEPDGTQTSAGFFRRDVQHGPWVFYNKDGTQDAYEYQMGKPLTFNTYYDSAVALSNDGMHRQAAKIAKLAKDDLLTRNGNEGLFMTNYHSLDAQLYENKKRYNRAAKSSHQAIKNALKYTADTSSWVVSNIEDLGILLRTAGEYEEALCTFAKGMEIVAKRSGGRFSKEYNDLLYQYVYSQEQAGKPHEAFLTLQANIDEQRRSNLSDPEALAGNALSLMQRAKNMDSTRYALALGDFIIQYTLDHNLTNHWTYPTAIYEKADILLGDFYQYDYAIGLMKEAINGFVNTGDTTFSQFYEGLIAIGNNYFSLGKYDSAALLFGEVQTRLARQDQDHYLYPKALITAAKNHYMLSRYQQATDLAQQGIDLYKKMDAPNYYEMSSAFSILGNAASRFGDYETADGHYRRSIEIIPSHTDFSHTYANAIDLYADFLVGQNRFDEAFSQFSKLDHYFSQYPDEGLYTRTKAAKNKGFTYYTLNQYDSSEHYYLHVLSLGAKDPSNLTAPIAQSLIGIGNIYEDKQEYIKAQSYNLQALDSLSKYYAKTNYEYIACLEQIATNFYLQGSYSSALKYYLDALALWEKTNGKKHVTYLFCAVSVGKTYIELGQPLEALDYLIQAKQDYESIDYTHSSNYTRCLNMLSKAYEHEAVNKLEMAISLQKQALKISKSIYGDHNLKYADALKDIGAFYSRIEEYEQAERAYAEALPIYATISGKNLDYAWCLNGMSWIQYRLGNYPAAIAQKEQVLDIYLRESPNSKYRMDALLNLGEFLTTAGRFEDAIARLDQVIDLIKETYGSYSYALSSPFEYKTTAYWRWKKPTLALQMLDQLESLYDSLGADRRTYITFHNNKGLLLLDMRQLEESKHHLQEALSIAEEIWPDDTEASAVYRNNLAFYYLLTDDFIKAEELWKSSEHYMTTSSTVNRVRWMDNMAALYQAWGKTSLASQYWNETLDILLEKIETDFPFLSESGKTAFWDAYKEDFEYFNSYATWAHSMGSSSALRNMYDHHLRTKSLLLSTSTKERRRILQSGDSTLIALYENYLDKKEQLARYYGYTTQQLKDQSIDIKSLERQVESTERALSIDADALKKESRQKNVRWKDVQRELAPGEAAIEIIRFRHFDRVVTDSIRYAALILTADTKDAPILVNLPNGNELEDKYLKSYLTSIRYKLTDKFTYAQYWEPIAQYLTDINRLYLSVDGVYNQISPTTIQHPDQSYLIDHYDIQLLTSTKVIPFLKSNKNTSMGQGSAYLFGYPKYDLNHTVIESNLRERGLAAIDHTERATSFGLADFVELPGTKTEIESVHEMLNQNDWKIGLYLQDEALEDELKRVRNPRLLHIATHGFFLEDTPDDDGGMQLGVSTRVSGQDPMLRSGLLMAGATQTARGNHLEGIENGIFTAYEAMNLHLNHTELVILSACETGRGQIKNGEGVYGLQRAFQIAGAEAIIMSLWKVDDQATQALINHFYQAWLRGKSKTEALQSAQMKVRQDYREPYYWGAFVLVQ